MISDPALVLVDMQNDFCKEWNEEKEQFETKPEFEETISAVEEFVERYRESGRTPIFVRAEHHENTVSEEWSQRYDRPSGMSCYSGSKGARFIEELDVNDDDVVVTKHRYNGFYRTDLDLYLSTNDISHILLGGVATNVCVAATLLGAYDRDYKVTLLSDCAGSKESDLHDFMVENVDAHFGEVRKSTDLNLDSVSALVEN